MAAEVFEEPIEFEIAILEAIAPGTPQYLDSSYPYPSLLPTSRIEKRTLRLVVLENQFVRARIVPDLGGRLISLFDKRTQTDILPLPTRLTPVAGGSRGAHVAHGIQIVANGVPRLNSLGPTATLLEHADDDQSAAGVWVGEVAGPLSFNALWSLEPDCAVITLEVRFLNRRLHPTPYNGGLSVDGLHVEADAGLAVLPFQTTMLQETTPQGGSSFLRTGVGSGSLLAPRQVDSWRFHIVPWSGIGHSSSASEAGVLAWHPGELKIHASRPLLGHKLILQTEQGPFEAMVDLRPEIPYVVAFDRLPSPPIAAALLDPDRQELLRFEKDAAPAPQFARFWSETAKVLSSVPKLFASDTDEVLRSATNSVLTRSTAYVLLGAKRLGEELPEAADEALGDALLFNGDDPLAWWAKAAAKRIAGEQGEIPELLNAHYLAPLEPALRTESLFAQDAPASQGPNPILNPLADAAEEFTEVACLLLFHGRRAEAARFIEEALRHSDQPMLRYLLAGILSSEPQMAVEASQHVVAASKLGFRPPYPWRDEEIVALQKLQQRFPQDELIPRFLQVATYRQVFAYNPTHGE